MALISHSGLCWLLCCANLASFSGFASAEALLPLPEIRVDPGVSTEEYDKVKAENAELEKQVKAIEKKLQEAEQHIRKAEQALAEQKSKASPVTADPPNFLDKILSILSPSPVDPSSRPVQDRAPFEPVMVYIKGGRFLMGCVSGKDCRDNQKVHPVTVDSFYMGQTEVTVSQYMECVNTKGCGKPEWLEIASSYDSYYKRLGKALEAGDHPIVGVNWNDARDYANWLSEKTDKDYRLPTEAQWEFAARAGGDTQYPWGNDLGTNRANCDGCGSKWDNNSTAPVKSFEPYNGLYDMAGNVSEWTCSAHEELYGEEETRCANDNDSLRVLRGGSWFNKPGGVRSASRYWSAPDDRYGGLGFRLSRIR